MVKKKIGRVQKRFVGVKILILGGVKKKSVGVWSLAMKDNLHLLLWSLLLCLWLRAFVCGGVLVVVVGIVCDDWGG